MRTKRSRNRQPAEFDPRQPPEIPGVTDLTLIGSGGSASVYKGQETALRRPVAVKILHTRLRDATGRSRFEGECERAGEVGEHPYAADIYRRGFADDWPFLAMRYYARGSLAGTLRFASRQPVGDALTICVSVACALQYAHNLSIVHRDVKPENILLDAYGNPALSDFGISTDLDDVTKTLRHAMTPAYAAPEVLQYGGGWPYSDVWSLAATLYALLAGRPPFCDRGQPSPQANLAALAGPLPPLGRPDVPDHVTQTLRRALIGRHDARTGSAQRFAEELNADLTLLGLPPVPIRIEPPSQPAQPFTAAPRPAAAPPTAFPAPTAFPSAQSLAPAPPSPPAAADSHRTEWGLPTTSRTDGRLIHHADQGRRWGDTGVGQPPGYDSTASVPDENPTGYLGTRHAYRVPQPEPARTGPGRRMRRLALAGGGAAAVAILAVAYLLAAPGHPAASQPGSAPRASAAATSPAATAPAAAAPGAATAGAGTAAIPPPRHVTAVAVSATSVRLSWTNAGPHAQDAQVIVSMGNGFNARAVPNKSPQLITGLIAAQPYCFAVGYFLTSGKVFYSKVTASSCVNGATPAAASGASAPSSAG